MKVYSHIDISWKGTNVTYTPPNRLRLRKIGALPHMVTDGFLLKNHILHLVLCVVIMDCLFLSLERCGSCATTHNVYTIINTHAMRTNTYAISIITIASSGGHTFPNADQQIQIGYFLSRIVFFLMCFVHSFAINLSMGFQSVILKIDIHRLVGRLSMKHIWHPLYN